jgi:hypothetical protein
MKFKEKECDSLLGKINSIFETEEQMEEKYNIKRSFI